MNLPESTHRQKYTKKITDIESNLKNVAQDGTAHPRFLSIQKKLDELAEEYQYDEEIGSARYKMYELQALLCYFEGKDDEATDFNNQAIETRGSSYPRAEKLKGQLAQKTQPKHGRTNNDIIFFHKSPTTVVVLSILTFNFYSIYWFYKHWRLIRLTTGERTFPILSAIFQIFTVYPLFKQIRNNANKNGYERFKLAGAAATGYILLALALNGTSRVTAHSSSEEITGIFVTFALGAGIAAILASAQKAANAHNVAKLGKNYKFKKIYVGEVIFSIIGILLFSVTMFASISNISRNSFPQGSASEISAQKATMDSLSLDYDSCSNSLSSKRNGVDTTNSYAVDSFNGELANCENTRQKFNTAVGEYNRLSGY